jgi:cobalt-zinc-cadmium efflux system protein
MNKHSCEHDHSHGGHRESQEKKLWFLLILTTLYMVAEIVGGWLSGSLALYADAGHMAIDGAAIGLSLFATWATSLAPDDRKTFGYYRAEILAALVNGATLIAISLWIFYEAWERFRSPQEVKGPLMMAVAFGGLLVNAVGMYLLHGSSHKSLNVRGVWLHLMTDLLGSLSAIVAGLLVWKFNWYLADPLISVVIGLLILFGAWQLVVECVNVLLEGVPKGMDLNAIRKSIEEIPGVEGVHDLHIWTVTSGVPSLSAHVSLKDKVDTVPMLQSITLLLSEKFHIDHVTVQLEPLGFDHKNLAGTHCNLGRG